MNVDDPRLTAYALGELSPDERAEIAKLLSASAEARQFVQETRAFAKILQAEYSSAGLTEAEKPANLIDIRDDPWFWSIARPLAIAAVLAFFAVIAALAISTHRRSEVLAAQNKTISVPLNAAAEKDAEAQSFVDEVQGELNPQSAASQAPQPTQPVIAMGKQIPSAEEMVRHAYSDVGGSAKAKSERSFVTGSNIPTAEDASRASTAAKEARSGAVAGVARFHDGLEQPAQAAPAAAPVWENGRADFWDKRAPNGPFNTAGYDHILENPFLDAATNPLSTFSIDVDTASYSNIRRFINNGSLPPKDAVRVEEMINYFTYEYPQAEQGKPFSINVDVAGCPWENSHRLVRIGLKGREVAMDRRGPSNLVFLLDVSGSMTPPERLPLVKQAMRLLVEKLGENDRVAIVVYAGASGLVLPSTTGDHKEQILSAIENLQPGGSTNGAEGIQLAYKIAVENFIKGGLNRVILATDDDFNVGVTSQGELIRLIEDKARTGVFLSVLGVGTDNLKDSTMQKLADKGNGNYAYLDSLDEARKVLVQQMNGTLVTIAKDVKVQVEFNPARVDSYRLIGYEKRILRKEDFNNDKVDAGEIGAGHTVTALYEVVPVGAKTNPAASVPPVDPLKYQQSSPVEASAADRKSPSSDEMLTVKLRHKAPDGDKSELTDRVLVDRGQSFDAASADLKFAAAVAEFGMILRDSEHKGNGTLGAVLEWANEGKGADANGYRAGFIELVRKAEALKKG